MFITTFTTARSLSLFWARPIQSVPHPTCWRSVLILSSYLCLGLSSGVFISSFPARTLNAHLLSPMHVISTTHLIILELISQIIAGEEYRSLRYSLCNFLHSPVTSFLLGANILFITLLLDTLSLRSSHNVSDQVSHPYKITGRILVLYILIFIF